VLSSGFLIYLNGVSSAGLCVLIWLTQLLIYPNFLKVPSGEFPNFHKYHMERISWVVAPLFVLDVIVCLGLLYFDVRGSGINGVLCLLPFLATFLFYAPLHKALEKSYSRELCSRLILSNWVRTLLWTLKLGYAVRWSL